MHFLVAVTLGVVLTLGLTLVLTLVLVVVRSWILVFIFLLVPGLNQIGTCVPALCTALVGAVLSYGRDRKQRNGNYR